MDTPSTQDIIQNRQHALDTHMRYANDARLQIITKLKCDGGMSSDDRKYILDCIDTIQQNSELVGTLTRELQWLSESGYANIPSPKQDTIANMATILYAEHYENGYEWAVEEALRVYERTYRRLSTRVPVLSTEEKEAINTVLKGS